MSAVTGGEPPTTTNASCLNCGSRVLRSYSADCAARRPDRRESGGASRSVLAAITALSRGQRRALRRRAEAADVSYTLSNYLINAPPSATLVASLVKRATFDDSAKGRVAYTEAFDGRVEAQRKSLIILFAPALAECLWALFARRAPVSGAPRHYGEHLVFSLHLLAFVWLVFAAFGGLLVAYRSLLLFTTYYTLTP